MEYYWTSKPEGRCHQQAYRDYNPTELNADEEGSFPEQLPTDTNSEGQTLSTTGNIFFCKTMGVDFGLEGEDSDSDSESEVSKAEDSKWGDDNFQERLYDFAIEEGDDLKDEDWVPPQASSLNYEKKTM
jgi:hypothetical protein